MVSSQLHLWANCIVILVAACDALHLRVISRHCGRSAQVERSPSRGRPDEVRHSEVCVGEVTVTVLQRWIVASWGWMMVAEEGE